MMKDLVSEQTAFCAYLSRIAIIVGWKVERWAYFVRKGFAAGPRCWAESEKSPGAQRAAKRQQTQRARAARNAQSALHWNGDFWPRTKSDEGGIVSCQRSSGWPFVIFAMWQVSCKDSRRQADSCSRAKQRRAGEQPKDKAQHSHSSFSILGASARASARR